jgi:hypothetical protein
MKIMKILFRIAVALAFIVSISALIVHRVLRDTAVPVQPQVVSTPVQVSKPTSPTTATAVKPAPAGIKLEAHVNAQFDTK